MLLTFSLCAVAQENTRPEWKYLGHGTEMMQSFTASFGRLQVLARELNEAKPNQASNAVDAQAALIAFKTENGLTRQFARNLRSEATKKFKAGEIKKEAYQNYIAQSVHLEFITADSKRILKEQHVEQKIAWAILKK